MRRLTSPLDLSWDCEEGASAVLVAITLVVLLGMTALVLDVGNLLWERRMLQNSADAAAIAAAQDFAVGEGTATAEATARDYADLNNHRGAFVEEFEADLEQSTVRALARTGAASAPGVLESWFASVIGFDDYFARAQAVARWGPAAAGNGLPLTFSWCEWSKFVGDPEDPDFTGSSQTIVFKSDSSEEDECTGPAGQNLPGGFGKLSTVDDECLAYVDPEDGAVDGDTGGNPPDCDAAVFEALLGQEVLVPIFDGTNELSGNNAEYYIIGFAGYILEGYQFPGSAWKKGADTGCSPNKNCIIGTFTQYVELGDGVEIGDTDLGASVVILTE